MTFIAELKRRNVIRMAGLYVVGAWLIVQVGETVLPIYDTPAWVLKALGLLLAVGFIPALVVSWIFELTPEGLKRDSEVSRSASIAPQTSQRMDRLFFAGLVLLILVIAADRYWPAAEVSNAALNATDQESIPASDGAGNRRSEGLAQANSIAVLPFVNISSDPEQEYFSDGISEEILNVLARMPGLRVAARTSAFSFKGQSIEIPQIAAQLNVRMVLEGSVRKQGDQVRITAQLIDASEGFHLWSNTYDRELKDIFAIQDEIARAIGTELRLTLGDGEAAVDVSASLPSATTDLRAHDLYLQGLALYRTRDGDSLLRAQALFEQAIDIDPNYANAHAGLALIAAVIDAYVDNSDTDQYEALGRAAASRAISLDPGSAEAVAALAMTDQRSVPRRAQVMLLLRQAIALNPSFADAHQWLGAMLLASGDLEAAVSEFRIAYTLDPKTPVIGFNLANTLLAAGQREEALALCANNMLTVQGDLRLCDMVVLRDALSRDDVAAARRLMEATAARRSVASDSALAEQVIAALEAGPDPAAAARLNALLPDETALQGVQYAVFSNDAVASILLWLGAPDLAMGRLVDDAASSPGKASLTDPYWDPLRCRDDFRALADRLGHFDRRAAQLCASGER